MHPPHRINLLTFTLPFSRSFSTTPPSLARPSRSSLKHTHRNIPPYPHGPSLLYKQSNFGLYSSSKPHYGNKISQGKNEGKTRRRWMPNVHSKRLWSAALNKYVRVKVQARVLRTIDKAGGLDEYLLGESKGRVRELGMEGWRLRWRLMQEGGVKERLRERRVALGVRPEGVERWLGDGELLGEEDAGEEEDGEGKKIEFRIREVEEEEEDEELEFSEEEIDRILREDEIARGELSAVRRAGVELDPPKITPRGSEAKV